MALTVCFKCDKCYLEKYEKCPHCWCHNFFCDDDTVVPAVHYLCEELEMQAAEKKQEKLRELHAVRWWQRPPRWYRLLTNRTLFWMFVSLIVGAILGVWLAGGR